jgi:hypothetical protein
MSVSLVPPRTPRRLTAPAPVRIGVDDICISPSRRAINEAIKRFDEIHGAEIFAREAFESRLSYWACDLWEYKFRAFEKAEAKTARRRGKSR